MRSLRLAMLLLALATLSSCVPGVGAVVQAPEFSVAGELRVLSFSPPLIGSGEVTLRLPLRVYNPNPVRLELSRLDFDFLVNNRLALSSAFTDGFGLAAEGERDLTLDISVPLANGVALVNDIGALVQGAETNYRLDGRVTAEILGVVEVFAKTTLVSGRIN